MHLVIRDVIHLDGQEGARAHMQGDISELHAHGAQCLQQGSIEVQRGGGGGDRACVSCPDSLVVGLILCIGGAFGGNIGRQRHGTCGIERRIEIIARQVEAQIGQPVAHPLKRGAQAVGEHDLFAGFELFHRFDERRPDARICLRLQQGRFYLGGNGALGAVAVAQPRQARGDHPRVIQHQTVTRAQPVRQVRHMRVMDVRALRHHQARRGARLCGAHGDQGVRQVKVKITEFHEASPYRRSGSRSTAFFGAGSTCGGVSPSTVGTSVLGPRNTSRSPPGARTDSGLMDTLGALADPPRL